MIIDEIWKRPWFNTCLTIWNSQASFPITSVIQWHSVWWQTSWYLVSCWPHLMCVTPSSNARLLKRASWETLVGYPLFPPTSQGAPYIQQAAQRCALRVLNVLLQPTIIRQKTANCTQPMPTVPRVWLYPLMLASHFGWKKCRRYPAQRYDMQSNPVFKWDLQFN